MAKKKAKKKAKRKSRKKAAPKVLFVQSALSTRDTMICEIVRIKEAVSGIPPIPNPLFVAALGNMSRRRVVACYAEAIRGAKAAGWDVNIIKSSPFDDIDL